MQRNKQNVLSDKLYVYLNLVVKFDFICLTISILLMSLVTGSNTYAIDSLLSNELSIIRNSYSIAPSACNERSVKIYTPAANPITQEYFYLQEMCVQEGKNFSLASDGARTYYKPIDKEVYARINLSKSAKTSGGSSDIFDIRPQNGSSAGMLVKYGNASGKITASHTLNGSIESYFIDNNASVSYVKNYDPLTATEHQNI